jgi:hypothetical protein
MMIVIDELPCGLGDMQNMSQLPVGIHLVASETKHNLIQENNLA